MTLALRQTVLWSAKSITGTFPTFNFNFNLIQRALVLEDYAPALGVAGFVSRKKGARSKGKEEKEGKKIIIVGKMIIYVESREVKII